MEYPTDIVFNEVKEKSIELWRSRYSDEFGYVSEKVSYIESVTNIKDNLFSIIGMFDEHNKNMLLLELSRDSLMYLYKQQEYYGVKVPWYMISVYFN